MWRLVVRSWLLLDTPEGAIGGFCVGVGRGRSERRLREGWREKRRVLLVGIESARSLFSPPLPE
jgi:hypothetical protein